MKHRHQKLCSATLIWNTFFALNYNNSYKLYCDNCTDDKIQTTTCLGNNISMKYNFFSLVGLRVVPLSLSPSSETVNKQRGKRWSREIQRARRARAFRHQEFARPFSLAVFFRVTHEGLSERGTTWNLQPGSNLLASADKRYCSTG